MGHCQVLPPLCPLQAQAVVVSSQHGLPCGSVTTGQEPVVDGFPARPHSTQILHLRHQGMSPIKRFSRSILSKAWSWRGVVFRGAPVDLPGTKIPVAACLRRMQLTVAWVRSMWPAIALRHMPSHANASTSCLISIGVGRGISNFWIISGNWEKILQLLIRTCHSAKADLGKWPPKLRFWTSMIPLALSWKCGRWSLWHWAESVAKVRSAFIGEHSQIHSMALSARWKKIGPYRFYCLKWGSSKLSFPREYFRMYTSSINHLLACLWSQWYKYELWLLLHESNLSYHDDIL